MKISKTSIILVLLEMAKLSCAQAVTSLHKLIGHPDVSGLQAEEFFDVAKPLGTTMRSNGRLRTALPLVMGRAHSVRM